MISSGVIAVNPSKIDAVLQWEAPNMITEIKSFIGLAGYYQRFTEGFSKLTLTLMQFTQKGQPFVWDLQCEENFQALTNKLTTAPLFILANHT